MRIAAKLPPLPATALAALVCAPLPACAATPKSVTQSEGVVSATLS